MLVIDDLTVRIAGRALLEDASARIIPGARVGLVGRNGSGKTTLFNVIAGDISPEHGIDRTAAALAHRAAGAGSAERAGKPARGRAQGRRRTQRAPGRGRDRARPASHCRDPDAARRYGRACGALPAPASILSGLGFSNADQARPCSEFSGGWRMRVALAATLFAEPDLLLLDEPTNYLDLEGTLWLQDHLARYPHTMMIISHDRDLLDNCRRSDPVAGGARSSRSIAAAIPTSNACAASAWCSTRR